MLTFFFVNGVVYNWNNLPRNVGDCTRVIEIDQVNPFFNKIDQNVSKKNFEKTALLCMLLSISLFFQLHLSFQSSPNQNI